MGRYSKIDELIDDMGGVGDTLDVRMKDILTLLDFAPCYDIHNILDIGMGRGQIREYFAEKGIHITATGLEIDSYGVDIERLRAKGIEIIETNVEDMPFNDDLFDAVVASHILEHVENTGVALQEMRRVLKDGGWLFLFIPEFSNTVCAGHINTGWNLGQLIYNLLLHRFNVKAGRFIRYGYSLCAYVQKDESIELPALRGDRGDIHILNTHELWPVPVAKGSDGLSDNFIGNMASVNWENATELLKENQTSSHRSFRGKFLNVVIRILVRVFGKRFVHTMGISMLRETSEDIINPAVLSP